MRLLSWLVPVRPPFAWRLIRMRRVIRICLCPVIVPAPSIRTSARPPVQAVSADAVRTGREYPVPALQIFFQGDLAGHSSSASGFAGGNHPILTQTPSSKILPHFPQCRHKCITSGFLHSEHGSYSAIIIFLHPPLLISHRFIPRYKKMYSGAALIPPVFVKVGN